MFARMRSRCAWRSAFPAPERPAAHAAAARARAPPDGWRHFARSDPLHSTPPPPTPVVPPILPPAAPVRSKYPADEVAEPRNAQEIRSRVVASGSATRVAC